MNKRPLGSWLQAPIVGYHKRKSIGSSKGLNIRHVANNRKQIDKCGCSDGLDTPMCKSQKIGHVANDRQNQTNLIFQFVSDFPMFPSSDRGGDRSLPGRPDRGVLSSARKKDSSRFLLSPCANPDWVMNSWVQQAPIVGRLGRPRSDR